ncbi:glycosyltransferase family 9 protein [Flavobacterium sp.]|uniref:glycosyltransferase family 9 protein n=1 Tax=Flavobacterium sp. TaxID=239 RepID=UPI002618FFF3|nr:glycosyltransferase family 9 protein [Flavobacterium sp.]
MKKILFLHDTSLTLKRGAELTITQLVQLGCELGYVVNVDLLQSFNDTKTAILNADLVILNSTSRCQYELELVNFLIDNTISYVKVEYDYNFCVRRNILCTVDWNIRNCCHTDKFHLFRNLFLNSKFNVFQSPNHYQSHFDFFGEAVTNHLIMPPTVEVDKISISEVKQETIPFFGELSKLKGGYEFIDFVKENPKKEFVVYGENKLNCDIPNNVIFKEPIPNDEVIKILGKTKTFFIKPFWPEPSGRLAAEAFLSGCELITNDKVGTWSFDFYPNDIEKARKEMKETPMAFWDKVSTVFSSEKPISENSLGNVLIYKSYGGLGDIFFTLPSIYKLKAVSDNVTFAVSSRLVSFFSKHLQGINVVDEKEIKLHEDKFDKVIELGNYPVFDRTFNQINYITGKKVKQHSIQHYIDAIARFHNKISNKNEGFPYFERNTNFENPFYTIHPGAGFLLKIWPTKNYADLIEELFELFPSLNCKIILGKEDPNPVELLSKEYSHIELVTGDLHDVGDAMAGALFHIGNDAGITHVAGSFNTPTVGIYGPTGPGSWGCFSEQNEIIWGKPGNCTLKCNYDVIMNCAHKVCLTSINIKKVISGLYALLQKTYPSDSSYLVVNPILEIENNDSNWKIKIGDNELNISFVDLKIKEFVKSILNNQFKENYSEEEYEILNVFVEQKVIFELPNFIKKP